MLGPAVRLGAVRENAGGLGSRVGVGLGSEWAVHVWGEGVSVGWVRAGRHGKPHRP